MITTGKVIDFFCIADDFHAEYDNEIQNHQLQAGGTSKGKNKKTRMSRSEIIAVMICFHCRTSHNFKYYYLFYICRYMKDYFPDAVSYDRFVELQPGVIVPFMLLLELVGSGEYTGITCVDNIPSGYATTSAYTRTRYSGTCTEGEKHDGFGSSGFTRPAVKTTAC